MALEKTEIVDKLKDEGINESLGNGLAFETTEELTGWVDAYKSGLPAPEKKLQDYTKEEIAELAKDPEFKGAKGLQGYIDSIRQKKVEKPPVIKPDPTDPPEWAKQLIEDNKALKAKSEAKEFDYLVSKLGKAESLNDTHIARVRKSLKTDATEADIKSEITAYKKEMGELGIKEFGTPGSGGKGNSSNTEKIAKQWRDEKLKQINKQ